MLSRFFKRATSDYKFRIEPAGLDLKASNNATLLQAALDQGIAFPHNCRAGGCANCKCRLMSGRVKEMTDKSYVLSGEELRSGFILACQSVPLTDVVVEVSIGASPAHPIVHTAGEIVRLEPLTHDILEVEAVLEHPAIYTAGQYAEIYVPGVVNDGARTTRCYSFAAAPGTVEQLNTVTFFIRHIPGGAFTDWLFTKAKVGSRLEGHGPYGNFWLRRSTAPLLCVAGGSGLAPILAILEQAQIEQVARDVALFFGARTQRDLYCLDRIEKLAGSWNGKFDFHPVLSAEPDGSNWQGLRGFIPEHFQNTLGERLSSNHAYLCGPPPMIDACLKVLQDAGIEPDHIHFDKFLDRSHIIER